jgi:hypothetical protein
VAADAGGPPQPFSVTLGPARLHFALAGSSLARMKTVQPHSWSAFPGECLLYLGLMGPVHLAILIAGCVMLAAMALKQRGSFFRRARRFGLFVTLLLVVGSIFNGLWSCLVWGRLYFSTDYVVDFSPFWPITQKVIDAFRGVQQRHFRGAEDSTWTVGLVDPFGRFLALQSFVSGRVEGACSEAAVYASQLSQLTGLPIVETHVA